jgi:class 3 adenylate cyclase/ligand-binding sensor domain-containing protein/predicted metal-dependent HD superfamily phosphohydrolase
MNFLHTSRRFNFIFSALILSLIPGQKISATHFQELGQPYIQTYNPGPYSYVNRYHSVTQDAHGFLYLGSQNGIQRFDGIRWKDLHIQGEFILSSSEQGIFGYNGYRFGYLLKTHDGSLDFSGISLDDYALFEKGDSIQRVLSYQGSLLVLTRRGLFSWEGDTPERIDLPFQADDLFLSDSEMFVFNNQEGVYLYEDGQLSLHTERKDIPLDRVSAFLILDGTRLMVDGQKGQARFSNGKGKVHGSPQLDAILSNGQYTGLIRISAGYLAWGTRTRGVVITDINGKVIKLIADQDGLSGNHVVHLFVDAMEQIWAVHPQSLSRIEFPSALTCYTHETGISGHINDLARFKGILYAATNKGLYSLVQATDSPTGTVNSHFRKVSGLQGECRQVIPANGSLYTLAREAVIRMSDEGLDTVLSSGINIIHYSASTNHLLAATDQAFLMLKEEKIIHADSSLKGILDMGESADGSLWLSSNNSRVYRSEQDAGSPEELTFVEYFSMDITGETDGFVDLIPVGGKILFAGPGGLYSYESQQDHFTPDTLFPFPSMDGPFRISHATRDANQSLWFNLHFPADGRNLIYIAEKQENGIYKTMMMPDRRIHGQDILCFYPEEGPVMWMGTATGVLRYDPSFASPTKRKFRSSIISIQVEKDPAMGYDYLHSDAFTRKYEHVVMDILFAKNSISFHVMSTDFGTNELGPLFQYRLAGLQENWSDWTRQTGIEYRDLSWGQYEFLVRGQDIHGWVSESDSFRFRIKPPFYFSWYATVIYMLLLLLAFIGYQKWRSVKHNRERFRLEEIIQERTEALIKEKEKTENLLANILPKKTADELKSKGKVTSSKYKMVTVLFADIEGFTKIAEQMNPDKLIDELDHFYFHFDSVVEKYNIEKIKTIGDAYMAAGGIPVKNRTNPVDVILAAMEMQHFMKSLKDNMADIWDLRIGIHTGSVIAGVVGQKKFSYDIWGDTVNTASRMESSGSVGKVNISASTYELVKEFFTCEYRGKMPVKYKGDIAMYFVDGIKPELCEEDGITPNSKFLTRIQLLRLLDMEDYIVDRLAAELSDGLLYHNVQHTVEVYRQVEKLGEGEGVSQEEMLLLKSAALLHDMGYIDSFDGHEERSVAYAREILPLYRFKEQQIDEICSLILATRLPPGPSSLLEKIICDANLSHLGRTDFLIQSDRLFQEYLLRKKIRNKKDWNTLQVRMLEDFEFYTGTAKRLQAVSAEQQIENIRQFS